MTVVFHHRARLPIILLGLALLLCSEAGAAGDADKKSSAWAFSALKAPEVPSVHNNKWIGNSVDAFILSKLEANGLAPAGRADKAILLRRVTLDLHGLPPSPAEVDAFLADHSSRAFETVVDRLLASPRY